MGGSRADALRDSELNAPLPWRRPGLYFPNADACTYGCYALSVYCRMGATPFGSSSLFNSFASRSGSGSSRAYFSRNAVRPEQTYRARSTNAAQCSLSMDAIVQLC